MDYPVIQARHYRPGRIKPVQLIVVHSMEAPEKGNTAESVARYFSTTDVSASAHFCIDADSIVQCVDTADTAYHCRGANANGIGLEHAGYARQTREQWLDEYGQAMLRRSAVLAAGLLKEYGIPAERALFRSPTDPIVVKPGLCGHVDVPNHGSHYDPGRNFPWDWYLERIQEAL